MPALSVSRLDRCRDCAGDLKDSTAGLPASEVQETVDARTDLKRRIDRIAHWNTVVVSQANCGYLPFAENWLHHAAHVNLSNYLIITEDEPSAAYLEQRHPGHVIPAQLLSATRPQLLLNENKFQVGG